MSGKLHTQQLSQVGGGRELHWQETTHTCVVTSSNALHCVALYSNCIHGLRYTENAGLVQRKKVGSKRREDSDVTQDQTIRKTAVRVLNLA